MDRLAAMRVSISMSLSISRLNNMNQYARQDDHAAYEMSDVRDNTMSGAGDMSAFYSEISSIQDSLKSFSANVSRIDELHSRSLNNTDDNAAQRNAAQLAELVEDTSALSATLKRRTALVKSKFIDAIQSYQQVEQQYRQKYKQRMERQFKIVKPDATPEEVRAVVNDDNGGQIFSQALMNSNRYGESRAAYREVQERHQDIQRIEQTIAELAQLFSDMSVLVEQQDETINTIEATAGVVEKDTEAGLGHTETAVVSARSARKKRWICFILTLIILAIIAIIVAVVITNNTKK
ncbi:t-SNARE [Melanogaster broomeanus]|nr:t-SNARE [Melanogaster broomeanus]